MAVATAATAPLAKEYNHRYDHLMAWAHSSNGPIKYSPDSIYFCKCNIMIAYTKWLTHPHFLCVNCFIIQPVSVGEFVRPIIVLTTTNFAAPKYLLITMTSEYKC